MLRGLCRGAQTQLKKQQFARSGKMTFALRRDFAFLGKGKVDKYSILTDPTVAGQEFDVAVIGGGSGGGACAMRAASLGLKVVLFDYVEPSPHGTSWGIGGTCVNVGCVPKKLFHHAGLMMEEMEKANDYGIENHKKLNWDKLVDSIQAHVKRSSFDVGSGLRKLGVKVMNAKGILKSENEITYFPDRSPIDGKTASLKAKYIVIAVGGRPGRPTEEEIPGSSNLITSDDIFSLRNPPGKTLLLGAGYIGVECASYLHMLGFPATILARSQLLRNFDRGCVNHLKGYLKKQGVVLEEGALLGKLEKIDEKWLNATIISSKDKSIIREEKFNTAVAAISRIPLTRDLNLQKVGVKISPKTLKIVGGGGQRAEGEEPELTSVPSIYAIGDVLEGAPELTPTAIKSGVSVADKIHKKLSGAKVTKSDNIYFNLYPTTVFSHPELSTCGLNEEEATKQLGPDNVKVFHLVTTPLEENLVTSTFEADKDTEKKIKSYFKVVCSGNENRVVGLHYVGLHAGEIMQGFAVR